MAYTIEQFYALKIPEVQKLFIKAIQDVVDRAILEEMIEAIEADDFERLFKASGYSSAVLNDLLDALNEVYQRAAEFTVDEWPKRISTPFGRIMPIFNLRNERVENDLRDFSSAFITNIEEEARKSIRIALSEGVARGDNPRKTALNIVGRINPLTKKREGGIIGLASNQTQWVENARVYLKNLDERYFLLTLRDKRFDSVVKKAISTGKKLTEDQITKLVTSYSNRALKYRADAISRTETIQAINRGKTAAIEQGIEEGLFKRENVKKWWDDTGDGRTRISHRHLGLKYSRKNSIGIDENFITDNGDQLRYPGDSSLGARASEIIHCRCSVQYEVNFLAE